MAACSLGILACSRSSRQALSVRTMPWTCFTAFSMSPFAWESYAGGAFSAACASSVSVLRASTLTPFRTSLRSFLMAGSRSHLSNTLGYPSHNTSPRRQSTAKRSSPTPFCGTTWAKIAFDFESLTMRIFSTIS